MKLVYGKSIVVYRSWWYNQQKTKPLNTLQTTEETGRLHNYVKGYDFVRT